MATTPNSIITTQTPKTATAVVATASTDLDDAPTTTELLLTASTNGARVEKVTAVPRATVTALRLDLWLSKDAGVTKRLISTVLMAAHTVTHTTAIPMTDFGYSSDNPLRLESNDRLYVSTSVSLAGGIVVAAQYADY